MVVAFVNAGVRLDGRGRDTDQPPINFDGQGDYGVGLH